jgi:type II secretory pathway pseudopilin PulG
MNKKGMTLIELLVYIALAALVLAPVIMLMNNSSQNMARDAGKTNLRMSGRDILNVIYDDLKNTGFKLNPAGFKAEDDAWNSELDSLNCTATICGGSSSDTVAVYDSSSFMDANGVDGVGKGKFFDSLTVKRGKLDAVGTWVGADWVSYYVEGGRLKRNHGGHVRTLTDNVASLQFEYSADLIYWDDSFNRDESAPHGDCAASMPGNDNFEACRRLDKSYVRYIKVTLVLRDPKQLAGTLGAREFDVGGGHAIDVAAGDQALYEYHEIVVPIPNNGLFPSPA